MTLQEAFDPRRNSLDMLRLVLALTVVVSHALVMQTGGQPYWGQSTLGDFAVDGFFILSGFLITRSYLQVGSFWRYAWHRFLRIMPGFWVCLLVTALVVAPLAAVLEGSPASTPFTHPPSGLRYLLVNAGLLINQYEIGGLLATSPTPLIFNGALWTLSLEALCYVLIALIGLTGLLRRLPVVVPLLAAALWVLSVLYELHLESVVGDNTIRMTLMFCLGASALLFADKVPLRAWLGLGAAAVTVVSIATLDNYRILGAVPFTYFLLWAGTCFPHPVRVRRDLSYGTYIYHWPILQLMALTPLVAVPRVAFVAVGMVAALLVAMVSWRFVEKPSLDRKHLTLPHLLRPRSATSGAVAPRAGRSHVTD